MDLAAQIGQFNARGVAVLQSVYFADFVLRGQTVRLAFGARISQRDLERYGFREEVSALVIVPDTAGIELTEGDILRLVATREEFKVKQIFSPANAGGRKAGLQRIERRA